MWKPAMLGASSAGTVPGSAAASLSGRKRLTQAHRRVSGLLLRASRNVQVGRVPPRRRCEDLGRMLLS